MARPQNLTVLSSLAENDDHYDVSGTEFLENLARTEDRHFWSLSRNRLIQENLGALGVTPPATFLELGCGGGCVSAHLSRAGYEVTGIEGHAALAERAALRAPAARFYAYDLSKGIAALDLPRFDAVGLFDVIEHLDDPRRALEGAAEACKPGGMVVGTVPALRSLWSEIDTLSGHRLRYERDDLTRLCQSVPGVQLRDVRYFNRALVPLMWLQRRTLKGGSQNARAAENLKVPPAPINTVLGLVVSAEQRAAGLLRRTPIPGASLWFALEKR